MSDIETERRLRERLREPCVEIVGRDLHFEAALKLLAGNSNYWHEHKSDQCTCGQCVVCAYRIVAKAEALLIEAYPTIKAVADAHVTHGQKHWSLRDRIAQHLNEPADGRVRVVSRCPAASDPVPHVSMDDSHVRLSMGLRVVNSYVCRNCGCIYVDPKSVSE